MWGMRPNCDARSCTARALHDNACSVAALPRRIDTIVIVFEVAVV